MIKLRKNLNLFDINFILCFVGFSVFTTFVNSSLGSVIYRALALVVAIICLLKTGVRPKISNKMLNVFLAIFILLLMRITYEMLLGDFWMPSYNSARLNVLLFGYGIGLMPLLAVVNSYQKLHHENCLIILFVLLSLILLSAIVKNGVGYEMNRLEMNARQSTLAFGDNGAYLSILSLAILSRYKTFVPKRWMVIVLIMGLLIGLLSIARAGSRGPMVSGLIGMFIIICFSTKMIKTFFLILMASILMSSAIFVKYFEQVAPVLYARTMNTIENNDTSGRDVLFVEAIDKIMESPIIGSNPVILGLSGNFSSYHNCYLTIGVGLGVIAMFIYISLILKMVISCLQYHRNYYSAWSLFLVGMFWFSIIRSMSGIFMISNSTFCTVMAFSCIIFTYSKKQLV